VRLQKAGSPLHDDKFYALSARELGQLMLAPGTIRSMSLRVVRESEVWRIANISYGSGQSLLDITARSPDGEARSLRRIRGAQCPATIA